MVLIRGTFGFSEFHCYCRQLFVNWVLHILNPMVCDRWHQLHRRHERHIVTKRIPAYWNGGVFILSFEPTVPRQGSDVAFFVSYACTCLFHINASYTVPKLCHFSLRVTVIKWCKFSHLPQVFRMVSFGVSHFFLLTTIFVTSLAFDPSVVPRWCPRITYEPIHQLVWITVRYVNVG